MAGISTGTRSVLIGGHKASLFCTYLGRSATMDVYGTESKEKLEFQGLDRDLARSSVNTVKE
jgi:predicted GNAT family acetyltransferase